MWKEMVVNRELGCHGKRCPFLSLGYQEIFSSVPESLGITLFEQMASCGFITWSLLLDRWLQTNMSNSSLLTIFTSVCASHIPPPASHLVTAFVHTRSSLGGRCINKRTSGNEINLLLHWQLWQQVQRERRWKLVKMWGLIVWVNLNDLCPLFLRITESQLCTHLWVFINIYHLLEAYGL